MNYYFLEHEVRYRIAELRRLAQQDALVLPSQRARGGQRRSTIAGWLPSFLRFDGLRHINMTTDGLAQPRRDTR